MRISKVHGAVGEREKDAQAGAPLGAEQRRGRTSQEESESKAAEAAAVADRSLIVVPIDVLHVAWRLVQVAVPCALSGGEAQLHRAASAG